MKQLTISVTRDELVARDACAHGLELFDSWFPDGTMHVPEWTWLHSVWLSIGETRYHADWLRGERIVPGADLTGADLTGAYLRWAYLRGANLRGANLRWADLTGAYLREADLRWANLRWAAMTGADLRGADLTEANLRWADLTGADLTGADRFASDPAIPGWVVVDGRLQREVRVA